MAGFLETLQAAIVFKRFAWIPRKRPANSSRKVLQTYSEMSLFCVKQYIGFQKESEVGPLKVFEKSLKTTLDKVQFYS